MITPPTNEENKMFKSDIEQAKEIAVEYFGSFLRLFGEIPEFNSASESAEALKAIENIILEDLKSFEGSNLSALPRIIDIHVLDKMEEIINSYK